MSRSNDYVYADRTDDRRARVFLRDNPDGGAGWDVDVFGRASGYQYTYTQLGACDTFRTLKDARDWVRFTFDGHARSKGAIATVIDGW